jgi:integrase
MICASRHETLVEFYRSTFGPLRFNHLTTASIEQYEIAIRHWSRFSGDVPINHIDDILLAQFAGQLLKTRRPATVNKSMRHVMAILREAKERKLISAVPRVRKLPEELPTPRAFLIEEITRLIATASNQAGTICGLPAGAWWRSLLMGYFNTGARYSALLKTRTADVFPDEGYLILKASLQKNHREHLRWLKPQTVLVFREIWSPSRELMWPWPFTLPIVRKHFKRIADEAGVPMVKGKVLHRLRMSFASYCEAGNRDATRELDHSARSVTLRYLDKRIVRESAVDVLPEV